MSRTGKVAIGRFVLRTKQYLATLRARDGVLVLATMLFDDEVVAPDDLEVPTATNTAPSKREINMATAAGRVAVGAVRPGQVPGRLPGEGAGADRGQGRGRDHPACGGTRPGSTGRRPGVGSGSQPGRGPPALGVTPAVATGVVVDAARRG